MELQSFCEDLAARLPKLPAAGRAVAVCQLIAGYFGVREHEVGLFEIEAATRLAILRAPASLGSPVIPVHLASSSLLALTIRERRGHLDNDFLRRPHLHMIERSLAVQEQRVPVQKIMSAPVLADGEVPWVVQVTRKGADRAAAGPDFTVADLRDLERIAGELAGRI